jgi:peroxiredoxin
MKRPTAILFSLIVLFSGLLLFSPAMAEKEQGQLPLVPDFSLKDLDGRRVALSDLLGRGPILIDFWATWCKPCIKELPHLHDLYLKYRDRGFQVVAISEDTPRSISKVKSFVAGNKYEFLVLLDDNGAVMRKFNFRALPYTVLLDKDGHVIHSRMGYRPGDERILEEQLLPLIEAQQTAGEDPGPPAEDEESSEQASKAPAEGDQSSEQAPEQPADAGQEDGGDEAKVAREDRSQGRYIKKVKGQEARKVQAEERDE